MYGKRNKLLRLWASCMLLIPLIVCAEDSRPTYLDGLTLYHDKKYHDAAQEFEHRLKDGSAYEIEYAAYHLALLYEHGQGVPQDYSKAIFWLQKAVRGSYADPKNHLGLMYKMGLGVDQDYVQAFRWFRDAAESGNRDAEIQTAIFYRDGLGVQQDLEMAGIWYRKATGRSDNDLSNLVAPEDIDYSQELMRLKKLVAANEPGALFELGNLYLHGSGVQLDELEALALFKKAAEQGQASAEFRLADLYLTGLGVHANRDAGIEWLKKSAEQGYVDAEIKLGDMFTQSREIDLGKSWYLKAALQGDAEAQYKLARSYDVKELLSKSEIAERTSWMLQSAEGGYANAQFEIGKWYGNGATLDGVTVVTPDHEKEKYWIFRAATNGNFLAQIYLGRAYSGFPYFFPRLQQDYLQATHWLNKAATQELGGLRAPGESRAAYFLGLIYAQGGHGIEKDLSLANTWFSRSADLGDCESIKQLAFSGTDDQRNSDRAKRRAAQYAVSCSLQN